MKDRNNLFDENYFSVYGNDPKREIMYRSEHDRIMKVKSSGKILDVGCGIGAFLEHFSSDNWQKFGVEVSLHASETARAKGISIQSGDKSYDYPPNFFDVIVMRGSLQHLPDPFVTIAKCNDLLSSGGFLIFLATPNTNSPYFWRYKTLPTLTESLNFLQPSDIMIKNVLKNIGFENITVRYPYLDTPYANVLLDHIMFFFSFFGIHRKFAFWKSMMEIYARKS